MVLPANHFPGTAPAVPCGLDRHTGPFDPVDELRGSLGTDWFRCRACRSLVTRTHAPPERVAA